MIFPYPFYETIIFMPQLSSSGVKHVPYFLSEFIIIFMFVRVYAVIRFLERYHEFTDLYSQKICRSYGFRSGRMFAFKCEINHERKAMFIVLMSTFSTMILAFILRVFEIPWELNVKTVAPFNT